MDIARPRRARDVAGGLPRSVLDDDHVCGHMTRRHLSKDAKSSVLLQRAGGSTYPGAGVRNAERSTHGRTVHRLVKVVVVVRLDVRV